MSADSLTEQDYYRWKNNALQPNVEREQTAMAAILQNKSNNAKNKQTTPWQAHVEREQTAMAAILQNKTNHAENEHPWQAYVESEETVVVADNPKAQD